MFQQLWICLLFALVASASNQTISGSLEVSDPLLGRIQRDILIAAAVTIVAAAALAFDQLLMRNDASVASSAKYVAGAPLSESCGPFLPVRVEAPRAVASFFSEGSSYNGLLQVPLREMTDEGTLPDQPQHQQEQDSGRRSVQHEPRAQARRSSSAFDEIIL